MKIIILLIVLLAIGYYYFFIHRKKILIEDMSNAVETFKAAIYGRFYSKYKTVYTEEKSDLLAMAVTNELFFDKTKSDSVKMFMESNKDIIDKEILSLSKDDEIRKVITQVIRVKATIDIARGGHSQKVLLNHIKELKRKRIMISGGETPSPETFKLMAYKFYKSTASKQ
mgnify:CR=1 FL=1|tara:strand:- start:323 stop:832 length:510 start_codon:yes stop_codon:yes gene_type:complete